MIKGLEKCSASSALFVFSQDPSGDYQLALGSKGKLVGRAVEALRENGLEAKWVYVCAWMKGNGFGELFQTPISAEALPYSNQYLENTPAFLGVFLIEFQSVVSVCYRTYSRLLELC
jgi:hypothetical protein